MLVLDFALASAALRWDRKTRLFQRNLVVWCSKSCTGVEFSQKHGEAFGTFRAHYTRLGGGGRGIFIDLELAALLPEEEL